MTMCCWPAKSANGRWPTCGPMKVTSTISYNRLTRIGSPTCDGLRPGCCWHSPAFSMDTHRDLRTVMNIKARMLLGEGNLLRMLRPAQKTRFPGVIGTFMGRDALALVVASMGLTSTD